MKNDVLKILHDPLKYEWTISGLGMLRLSLSPTLRLNIWDERLIEPGVSLIHNHPWHFQSVVILGFVVNAKYGVFKDAREVNYRMVGCGANPNDGTNLGPIEVCHIAETHVAEYYESDAYAMNASEIHKLEPLDGSVTLISKIPQIEPTEWAMVFWPVHEPWGDARIREARPDEITSIIDSTLEKHA